MTTVELEKALKKYDRLAGWVAYKILRDREDVLDCVQTSRILAWKYLASFRYGERFDAWYLTIVRNTAINMMRRNKVSTRDTVSIQEVADELVQPPPEFPWIRDIAYKVGSSRTSIAFRLFLEEFSIEEIAEMMDTSLSTTRVNVYRGKLNMREEIRRIARKGRRLA